MQKRIRVGDVMTRKFVSLNPDTNLLQCAKTMIKKRVGSIVLKDSEKVHGMITERDVIWALTKKHGGNIKEVLAKDIATKKIISIKPEASLSEALSKINKKKVKGIPVVSNKKIVGYITLKDILKFRPSLLVSIEEFQNIKEESEKIQRSKSAMKGNFLEAPCEDCANFDILEKVDGRMICESCRDSM